MMDDNDRISMEEMNAHCDEALHQPPPEPEAHREGIDWIRTEDGDLRHPLQHRCFESALKFSNRVREFDSKLLEDTEVADAVFAFMTTSVKLCGALDGLAHGQGYLDDAFTVALLKRSLGHLQRAQTCLESEAVQKLLPESIVQETRQEMFAVREEIIRLMDHFRGRG